MLTTAGQATDRWWPLPGSSVSTSALQLLAGRPRDNSATGSPIHLHNIYLSTYLHIYTMKHTWPGVSITDHTGQWPGPKQCWFMRVIHVIEFSPNIFTVYSVYIVSTHCDACFGQHWTHQIIFILPRRYTIHLEMKKNQDIAELFTCVFFKHSL